MKFTFLIMVAIALAGCGIQKGFHAQARLDCYKASATQFERDNCDKIFPK